MLAKIASEGEILGKRLTDVDLSKPFKDSKAVPEGAQVKFLDTAQERLLSAIKSGLSANVERAIFDGANVNAWDDENCTPLMQAVAGNCNLEILRMLIEKGADVNAQDAGGRTALLHAVIAERKEMVMFLIRNGANVDPRDDSWTPLHHAACQGNLEIVRFLVESGADINARTKTGETPLSLAESGAKQHVKSWRAIKYLKDMFAQR